MKIDRYEKAAFSVMGKEGSTLQGAGFIQQLWGEANAHFSEIEHLALRDENGQLCGLWGAMSDMSRSFLPWEDGFTRGLYLAGVECAPDAEAPEGWSRWDVPGYEYLCVEAGADSFVQILAYLQAQGIALAGAVHDFTCPATGMSYQLFPIRKL